MWSVSSTYPTKKGVDMELDMVANLKVDKVADMVAAIEMDKVADMFKTKYIKPEMF